MAIVDSQPTSGWASLYRQPLQGAKSPGLEDIYCPIAATPNERELGI